MDESGSVGDFDEAVLFDRVLKRYFGGRAVHAPALQRLAALAQFDIEVPLAELPDPLEPRYEDAVRRLTVVAGQPATVAFGHASAAEVIFRVLCYAAGVAAWRDIAAEILADFLEERLRLGAAGCERDLHRFLKSRLSLEDDLRTKQSVLKRPEIIDAIGKARLSLPVQVLSLATFLTRDLGLEPLPYGVWLVEGVESLVARVEQGDFPTKLPPILGNVWRSLVLADGRLRDELEERVGPTRFGLFLEEIGAIPDLLRTLQNSSTSFAIGLLDGLDSARAALVSS